MYNKIRYLFVILQSFFLYRFKIRSNSDTYKNEVSNYKTIFIVNSMDSYDTVTTQADRL